MSAGSWAAFLGESVLFDGRDVVVSPAPPRGDPSTRRATRWVIGFFVGMLGLAALASPNPVSAQVALWIDPPNSNVRVLADDAGMTDAGRAVFFANSPTVESRGELTASCHDDSGSDGSGDVLGCYDPTLRSIHLLIADDPDLEAVAAGVAAHEMLHALWWSTDASERDHVASLITREWERQSQNPEFVARMNVYSDLDEPGFTDELHSILATEVPDIGAELEAYYDGYLDDRQGLAERTGHDIWFAGD